MTTLAVGAGAGRTRIITVHTMSARVFTWSGPTATAACSVGGAVKRTAGVVSHGILRKGVSMEEIKSIVARGH